MKNLTARRALSNPLHNVPRRWKIAILSGAALAFICKILLALDTFGTNDVYAWERFAHWSGLFGSRLYSLDAAFNHPPSMIHVLAAMSWLAKTTGIFFPFWLRMPAILADAGALWILLQIFAKRLDEPLVRWGLLVVAVSPILILVSGFHGNTDPVVMFFLLLSVWLTEEKRDVSAGMAFGAAMCIKILPVILLPIMFFARRGFRKRMVFLATIGIFVFLSWLPYLFRDPVDIFHQVFGYQSIYGHWGISWLAYHLAFFRDPWHDALLKYGTWVVLGAISITAWVLNRRPNPPSVYMQTGAAFFFFLAAMTGFGVQYLSWLVPWTVGLALVPSIFFELAGGAFLFAVYNWWSGGFPWFLADSNYVGDFTPHLDYLLTVSWIAVIVLAVTVWRRASIPRGRAPLLWAAAAIVVIAYPAWNQIWRLDARTYPASDDHNALTGIHAHEYAQLSDRYYSLARYQDATVAARTGVALAPDLAEAWTSLAKACIRLQRWDEALNAAESAVRLAPDDEAANEVLAEISRRH